jgi:hypothetical protein
MQQHQHHHKGATVTKMSNRSPWGPWALNRATYALGHTGDIDYWIDLDSCTTSAEVLDWIAQISHKTWADDATLAGLVRALDDVLNLQAHLCPSGASKQLTVKRLRSRVDALSLTTTVARNVTTP